MPATHDFLYLNAAFGTHLSAAPDESLQAKAHLRAAGWSYRTAAPRLGVTYQHLCYVLNGQRESRRLLANIIRLPTHRRA